MHRSSIGLVNGISAARYEYLPLSEIEWRNILKKSLYIMETKLVTLLLDKEVSQTILFHSKTKARYKLCHTQNILEQNSFL